jgi:pimeloyl-ACP methyl ester carboxylesterase
MPMIPFDGLALHCAVDDYLWPWQSPTPVLMLHGFSRNATFWNRWVPAIAETHRIYRPDLLGCGDSEVPAAGYEYTVGSIGGMVIAAMDAMKVDRVHWVGESSGGIVGLLLAAAHPERIASLVLCNTPTRISEEIKRIYALDKATASDAMEAYGVGHWCRQTLGYRLDLDHADKNLQDWVVNEMDRVRPDIAAGMHDCFEGVDTLPILPQVKAPVMMLSGDKSRIASASQKAFAERLPNARLELIEGYGHGVNLLVPDRCARATLAFWQSIGG